MLSIHSLDYVLVSILNYMRMCIINHVYRIRTDGQTYASSTVSPVP